MLELLGDQATQLPILLLQLVFSLDTFLFDLPLLFPEPLTGDPQPLDLTVFVPDLGLKPIQLSSQLVVLTFLMS